MTPAERNAVGALGATAVIVVLGLGYALGTRSTPVPAPVLSPAATRPPPAQPPVTRPDPAAVAEAAAEREVAALVARSARIAAMTGEELVGTLWEIEQRADPSVTYAMLERNADRYAGRGVVFTGEVLEIQDIPDEPGSFLRVGVGSDGAHPLAVVTLARPPDDVVRGRRVRVYGLLNGTFSYRSQAGWEITIPRLTAVAVVRASVPRRPARSL